MEDILGWKKVDFAKKSIKKTLRRGAGFRIVQCNNGVFYLLDFFPQLSKQEEVLVKNVFDAFLQNKKEQKSFAAISDCLNNFCAQNFIELDENQKDYISKIVELIAFEFGPISCFLKDPLIEEVSVIGLGKQKPVYVYEKNFGWLKSNLHFVSEEEVKNIANKMARKIGRHLSLQNPKINAFLPDGSRLNACIDPIALEPTITIRKFKETPFTPPDLISNKTISADATAFLWLAMQSDVSMLVCGNTGSGKTTTLNALFSFGLPDERIIITEETPEINLIQEHVVKLKTVENIGVKMTDLIVNTFRMRPDRIIVGEIRESDEVHAFVNTLLAGQAKGSFATFHAKTAQEAVLRLKKLGVQELDLCALDLILCQRRWTQIDLKNGEKKEIRRVTEICEVLNENGNLKLNTVFDFDWKNDCLKQINQSVRVIEKICKSCTLSQTQAVHEIQKRAAFLQKMCGKEISIKEFFEAKNNARI